MPPLQARWVLPIPIATLVLAASCAAPRSERGSENAVRDPLRPAEACGTWALSDGLNNGFDLVLASDGSAHSTWSRADPSKPGESGTWRIERGRVTVDLTSGWRDEIVRAPGAFAAKGPGDADAAFIAGDLFSHLAWGPGTDREGPPSNGGQAVKLKGAWVNWVGLWVEKESGRRWTLQSDNLVFGGDGNPAMGLWHVMPDCVAVQWADGRRSELRVKDDHLEVTTVGVGAAPTRTRLDRIR